MSQPITLDETILVNRPLHEVFAYVAEFSHVEEWDPAVAAGHNLSTGAPAVGSEFKIDMKGGLSLHYRITEYEANKRLLMAVNSRLFTAVEEIRFEAVDGDVNAAQTGTRLRYIAKFQFPAPLAAVNNLFPAALDRVGKSSLQGLREALEDNFDPPAPSKLLAAADKLVLPGLWRFTRLGYRNARKRWQPLSARLDHRNVLITGATSGVGQAAAEELAGMGARLTLVARSQSKAEQVASELREKTGNPAIAVELADMSNMADVHHLVTRLCERAETIDVLINNAGALFNPRQQTQEGLEKSFALLLLGPYILTEGLQPLLAQSGSGRVVNVLSGGMYSQKIRVRDLQSERGEYSGAVAYARAKRGLMILTEEWAQRWRREGIAVNAMHPGWADTPGVETALPGFYKLTRRLLRTPKQGADTVVWLAAATEAANVSGEFWLDREQHPSHLSKKTIETSDERQLLLLELESLAKSTQCMDRTKPLAKSKPVAQKKSSKQPA